MNLSNFTENELETISASMDDYINYDDESLSNDELIGGLSVEDRVNSKKNGKGINKYDIMRQHLINYLIANERAITLELSK